MKAVTAHLLRDGRVVYLGTDDRWVDRLDDASRLDPAIADAVLANALARATEIAGVYLIDIDPTGLPAGRDAIKERIRSAGPTVRPDLGKQAMRAHGAGPATGSER